jgi:choice-of-anchor A domain-containing protein
MLRILPQVLVLTGVGVFALQATAAPLTGAQVMQTYNLTVLGNLTSSSEVEGRTYVRGSLGGSSSTYFTRVGGSSDLALAELVVGGSISANGVNLNNSGRALVAGNVNNLNLNGGTARVGGTISGPNNGNRITRDSSVVVPDYTQAITDYSRDLAKLSANSSVRITNNRRATFTATPNAQGQAVVTISDADSFFNSISEISIALGNAQSLLINVGGTSATIAENFIGGLAGLDQRVFWNFYDAQNLNVNAEFFGSLLAPKADLRNTITLNGSVAVRNFTQNGEVHTAAIVTPHLNSTIVVAEPTSAPLFATSVALMLAVWRRRQTASTATR